jgi:FkbM family methyltransferase
VSGPYELVDGNLVRSEQGSASALARIRSLRPVRAALAAEPVRHLASARALGSLVRERGRFVANELRGAEGVRRYRRRESGLPVLLRHGTDDVWTFDEVFRLRLYHPPDTVAEALGRLGRPLRILDLGANIGMFGVVALELWPDAEMEAFEPDPVNAPLLRRVVEGSGNRAWRIEEVCAGTETGEVAFASGLFNQSHVVAEATPGAIARPVLDVLPRIAAADLVKIDIEGAEWPLLADDRFGGATAVVMEYHPEGCPENDPHAAAARLLEGRGYEVLPIYQGPDGVGMLWAMRPT